MKYEYRVRNRGKWSDWHKCCRYDYDLFNGAYSYEVRKSP